MSIDSLNSSVATNYINNVKSEPKVQTTKTEVKEESAKLVNVDSTNITKIKGEAKAKIISIDSEEAKKIGLSTGAKVGITTGGVVAGLAIGAKLGKVWADKLPNGTGYIGAAILRFGSLALAGGLVGGVGSNIISKNVKVDAPKTDTIEIDKEKKTVKGLSTGAKVGITTGGVAAGLAVGGTLGYIWASKLPPGTGYIADSILRLGSLALAGGIVGGVGTGILVSDKDKK